MALQPTDNATGYAPGGPSDDTALPIISVEQVRLQFNISADFVASAVANNVLILALATNRILRFDLEKPEDIDDIDLPKKPAEVGVIRKVFLDPSASHLLVTTTLGENFYVHSQGRNVKGLRGLRGVSVESVAWNPSSPTASTREILVGAADGSVIETYIEPSTEFYRREERFVKNVFNTSDGAVVGLYADVVAERPEVRRVVIATKHKLWHFSGRTGRQGGGEGSGSVYARLFEGETPAVHELEGGSTNAPAMMAVSPDPVEALTAGLEGRRRETAFGWLNAQGVFHGKLLTTSPDPATLGKTVLKESKILPQSKLPPVQSAGGRPRTPQPAISSILLTQFHILALVEGKLTAVNRLNETVVYSQQVLEPGQQCLGLFSDQTKNTFWLFTSKEIYEIVVTDEDRDVWKIQLNRGKFEEAQQYAKTAEQRDIVAGVLGDHIMDQGRFDEAAVVLGRSTKPFEDVALIFIDKGEQDALRKYLRTKLENFKKDFKMQRTLLASWLVELYMAKLNQLDDTISTNAEVSTDGSGMTAQETQKELPILRKEFREFCTKYKPELDRKTVYEIISSHGREEELLYFATVVEDFNYVISYWVQRERWNEAMAVLKKQTEPEMFYKYATVLMAHTPVELVEVLMRQGSLEAKRLIPALLNYNKTLGSSVPLAQNQAARFLLFCINNAYSTDPAVHNTLISLYASNPSKDESALLSYLETQSAAHDQFYDADFALRLCIAHQRVASCVHIYTTMKQYAAAVDLALKYDEVELAAEVADRPGNDDALRKKLWLKVAKRVIGREKGIKSALEFLKRCELLRIEDLIPFFPDFIVIDAFKEEICAALEDYSRRIDELKTEMDDSASTAQHIKDDIRALDSRYAIVEPGERCYKCRLPLLMRQFFVFPCQHAFHADCLGEMVMRQAGIGKGKRIKELQKEIGRGVALGKRREGMVRELDGLVAGACVLCSEMAVRMVDEPFIGKEDNREDWAV